MKFVSPLGCGDNALNALGRERSFQIVEEGYAEAGVGTFGFVSKHTTPLEATDILAALIFQTVSGLSAASLQFGFVVVVHSDVRPNTWLCAPLFKDVCEGFR